MKVFYSTRYRFFNDHTKKTLNFFLISDVHFSYKVTNRLLQSIAAEAKRQQPNYICITGDLVDSQDMVASHMERQRLFAWLEQLGTIAPVLISLGNHDFYQKMANFKTNLSRQRHWRAVADEIYFEQINALPNVHLLNNSVYEDRYVYILGFTQSPEYFQLDRDEEHSSTVIHPGGEDKARMLHDLNQLPEKQLHDLPFHKVKIALIHSPVYLHDPKITTYFDEFDFYISGHMHNGCVPPILNELWVSDRGFVAPGKALFPKGTRGRIKSNIKKLILLGAVTTVQECAKPVGFLNKLYPVSIANLEVNKNPVYKRKPDIYSKYVSIN